MKLRSTPFELRVNGQHTESFRTSEEAVRAARELVEYDRWSVDERVGSRRFNVAFGYRAGTTSTNDLAAMGVGIAPGCLNDRKL